MMRELLNTRSRSRSPDAEDAGITIDDGVCWRGRASQADRGTPLTDAARVGSRLGAKFAQAGTIAHHGTGDVLVTQGDSDNDLFLILSGEVDVLVNGRHVALGPQGPTWAK